MIKLKNPENIGIFESFTNQFEAKINEKSIGNIITIIGINEQHQFFSAVATNEDPFAINIITKPLLIAINEQVCEKLEFTKEEQYAMIAHEIGHILDRTPKLKDDQLRREFNADQFAVNLGLNEELKNGLKKIVESGNHLNEVEDIKKRIAKLN